MNDCKCVADALPVIRWRGWRPLPLDMTSSEQGGQVFLVLGREGDIALLPTATVSYICYAPLDEGAGWGGCAIDPIRVTYSTATTWDVVRWAVQELAADGWRVIGRLEAVFCGVDTEADFWARLDCGRR